jgi:RNA polymerase sigma-70 factor (ECF subfamily)
MAGQLSDPRVFERIYDEHGRAVYGAAMRILANPAQAQDVTQDVFLRLWRRPRAFDARRGELGAYLRLMARSRALDLWREGQAAGRASDRLKHVVVADTGRVEEAPALAAERDEARAAVRSALGRLPSAQREALVLAYWGGMTADEIARRSQVPLGTAKSRIRLGIAKLREECTGLLDDERLAAAAA